MDEKLELWYKFEPSDVDPVTKVLTNHGNPSSDISGDAVFNVDLIGDTPANLDAYFINTDKVFGEGCFHNPNYGTSRGYPQIKFPEITLHNHKEFTLSYWHKQTALNSTYDVLNFGSDVGKRLRVVLTNQKYEFDFFGKLFSTDHLKETTSNSYRLNTWFHYCVTYSHYLYDGTTDYWMLRLYHDGTLINETPTTSAADLFGDTDFNSVTRVFNNNVLPNNSKHINGYIDDFRFYTKALDVSEVKQLGYVSPNIKPTNVVSLRKQGNIKFSWDEPSEPVNQYDITYVDHTSTQQAVTVNTNSFAITEANDSHIYNLNITATTAVTPEYDNLMTELFSAGYDPSTGVITTGSLATDHVKSRQIYEEIINAQEFTIRYKDLIIDKQASDPIFHEVVHILTANNGEDNANQTIDGVKYSAIHVGLVTENGTGTWNPNTFNIYHTGDGSSKQVMIPNIVHAEHLVSNNSDPKHGDAYTNLSKNDIIFSYKDNKATYIINGVSKTITFDGYLIPPVSVLSQTGNYALDELRLFHRERDNFTGQSLLPKIQSIGSVQLYLKYIDSVPGLGASASTSKTVTVPESLPTIFPPFPNRIATADNVVSLSKLSEDDLTDPAIVGSTLTDKRATSKNLIKDFMKGFKSTIGSNKLKISKNAILPGYSLARDVFVFNAAQGETDLSDSLVSEISYDDAFGKDFYVVMDNSDTITIPSHDDTVQIVKNTDNTYTLTNSLGDITKPANSIYQYNGLTLNLGSVLGHLTDIICFKEGTKVLCYNEETQVEYEKTIESIKPGMYLKTYKHGYKKVELMNSREIRNPGDDERSKNRLYKLEPAQYPELKETLYLTGCHALLVDKLNEEQTTQVKDTLGEIYITDDKYRLPAMHDPKAEPFADENKYTVWHVCLEHEDQEMNYGIYVNGGLLTESCCKRNILLFNEEMKK